MNMCMDKKTQHIWSSTLSWCKHDLRSQEKGRLRVYRRSVSSPASVSLPTCAASPSFHSSNVDPRRPSPQKKSAPEKSIPGKSTPEKSIPGKSAPEKSATTPQQLCKGCRWERPHPRCLSPSDLPFLFMPSSDQVTSALQGLLTRPVFVCVCVCLREVIDKVNERYSQTWKKQEDNYQKFR